ncbi:DNA-directed RNA polymerase subunit beta-beta protein, putative [Actinidia rufa]|uniref:DNA-directed RNA polymerase subunit beta-beta protein, putative n=1 Tax=Actinidia rufa TaxID=165716 RepID=A0A7J0EGM1_9ERIC|nr:DNA-directed RNA polymerase subunit beta-beta protein, putative [Actinidia rufa]
MGSSEEERLIQMVTDFIESEGSPQPNSPQTQKNNQKPTISTLQDVLMRVTNAETLILEKILIYLKDMEFIGEPNHLKKLIVLRLIRDGFEASLCRTSWLATFGRPSVFEFTVDYEYVDVMMKDKSHGGEAVRLIVDMDFRSQFELARPTSTYLELLSSLPAIFVGTEEKLVSILSLLCSAAKQSLKERGLHMPPWRKANYMQSKWLSDNCKKIPFNNNG